MLSDSMLTSYCFFIKTKYPSTLHCINRVLPLRSLRAPVALMALASLPWDPTHSPPAHGLHCSPALGLQSLLEPWWWHTCA